MIQRLAPVALVLLCLGPPLFAEAPRTPVTHQVPYRLSDTKHVVVRVKINGKGPFNLIVDTGAPALYLTKNVGKKLGIEADKSGWATLERLELEGGLVMTKARGRIEDLFQIEGMNGLGAAGVELHGLMGYNILAQYRIEYDFTSDKMNWTRLDYKPAMPERMGKGAPANLDAMGAVMKVFGALLGRQANQEVALRGFLGFEVADKDKAIAIQAVLADSPAAQAGLQAGDVITHFQDKALAQAANLRARVNRLVPGEDVNLTIRRGAVSKSITFKAGKGL